MDGEGHGASGSRRGGERIVKNGSRVQQQLMAVALCCLVSSSTLAQTAPARQQQQTTPDAATSSQQQTPPPDAPSSVATPAPQQATIAQQAQQAQQVGPVGQQAPFHVELPHSHNPLSPYMPSNVPPVNLRSEEHTSELQSRFDLVCRL